MFLRGRPASQPVFALVAVLMTLGACTPTFNWREVPLTDSGLVALLPCKPDRATRALPLGADSVQVEMAGCEAGGATFAIAHAGAADAGQAEAWLKAWRTATRTQLAEMELEETAATLPRAATSPAPLQLEARGGGSSDGVRRGTPARVLWFAQRERSGGVSLYQATVLGQPSSSEAIPAFFEGLRLP